jgi:lipooligosaccharide transport system ATP-binding protein
MTEQLSHPPVSRSYPVIAEDRRAVLEVRDLWKIYRGRPPENKQVTVVQGVEFSLHSGEVLGLLGPNGAGKTTTVGMLYGAVTPSQGYVQLGEYRIPGDNRLARAQVGVVTQDDNIDPDFTIYQNLLHFAHHYRMVGRKARQRAEEVLEQVNLTSHANYRVDEISGGMRRRLVLARALLNHPKVIFLDEPTTGLDPEARQDFWKIVTELKRQGCGVLLTTHYMDEAQRLCDRLILLQSGRIIDEGTPLELIHRIVGHEVVEIEGVPHDQLEAIASCASVWGRSFGSDYLMALPEHDSNVLWDQIVATQPEKLTRRRANLEDVFLRLTGSALS